MTNGGNSHQRKMLAKALARARDDRTGPRGSQYDPDNTLFAAASRAKLRETFIVKTILRFDIFSSVVLGILLAAGLAMLGIDWFPRHLLISQISFGLVGLSFTIKVLFYAIDANKYPVEERVFFAVVLSIVLLGVPADAIYIIQQHANQTDPLENQVRLGGVIFAPPVIGQKHAANVPYENYGPSTIKLAAVAQITTVDGTAPFGDAHRADRHQLEENVWNNFVNHPLDLTNYQEIPPLKPMFTTVEGHVATPEEFKNLTANSQRDLVFLVARFHWIDGDSGRDFYFDSCQFIAGDPGAVFTCDGHNGPVRPGQ